jgi:hypothetical protein
MSSPLQAAQDEDIGPSDDLDDVNQSLRMLSLAEDQPTDHARGMWILAANFAKDGYHFSNGRPLQMDITRSQSRWYDVA